MTINLTPEEARALVDLFHNSFPPITSIKDLEVSHLDSFGDKIAEVYRYWLSPKNKGGRPRLSLTTSQIRDALLSAKEQASRHRDPLMRNKWKKATARILGCSYKTLVRRVKADKSLYNSELWLPGEVE